MSRKLKSSADTSTVRSVERALDLLELFMETTRSMSLAEVSERTSLHPSTAHRLLATLDKRNFVNQDSNSKLYSLGTKFMFPIDGVQSFQMLRNMAHPVLQKISDQSGEGVSFCIRSGNHAMCIAKVSSGRSVDISLQNGALVPLHATAVGKAILSQLAPDEVRRIIELEGLAPSTVNTITDIRKLETILKEARSDGYAMDYEEWEIGIRCIAVPVLAVDGNVIGAISVSGPAGRMSPGEVQRIANLIQAGGHKLSEKLGYKIQERV